MNPILLTLVLSLTLTQAAYAEKSTDECDSEVPEYIKGRDRQHHVMNCLLVSSGQTPSEPTSYEKPIKLKPNPKEWTYLYTAEDNIDTYINTRTIKRSKNQVKAWFMNNSEYEKKLQNGKYFKSLLVYKIFDCNEKTYDLISMVFYEKQIGGGKSVRSVDFNESNPNWKQTPPGTSGETNLEAACKRRK